MTSKNNANAFLDWLDARGLLRPAACGAPCTHAFLDGTGCAFVPFQMQLRYEMSVAYIEALFSDRCKQYCVERLAPNSRCFSMFIDIDESSLSPESLLSRLRDAPELETWGPVYVACSTGSSGKFHVVWPERPVDVPTASRDADMLSTKLACPVDQQVYLGRSGLRMLWSFKKNRNDYYYPFNVKVDGMADRVACVWKYYSLHCHAEVQAAPWSPPRPRIEIDDSRSRGLARVQDGLRGKGFDLSGIKELADDVVLIRTNSRYCMRLQRNHRSNHVYFIVDLGAWSVHQRCHSPKCQGYSQLVVL